MLKIPLRHHYINKFSGVIKLLLIITRRCYIMKTMEKEIIIKKNSYHHLAELLRQINGCVSMLKDATEMAAQHCAELKNELSKQPEEIN